jgi:hypothetical protein
VCGLITDLVIHEQTAKALVEFCWPGHRRPHAAVGQRKEHCDDGH